MRSLFLFWYNHRNVYAEPHHKTQSQIHSVGSQYIHHLAIAMVRALAGTVHPFDMVQVRCGACYFYYPWLLHLWIDTRHTLQLVESSDVRVRDLASHSRCIRHTGASHSFSICPAQTWDDDTCADPIVGLCSTQTCFVQISPF